MPFSPSTLRRKPFSWAIFALLCLVVGLEWTASAAEIEAKAAKRIWLSSEQLREKWGKVPMESVERAAEGGEVEAQHYWGMCLAMGERVAKDEKKAVTFLRRASDAGYLPAASNLGWFYVRGIGLPRDPPKGLPLIRPAAEAGIPEAQHFLGLMQLEENGALLDEAEGEKWTRKAAENGHADAQFHFGYWFCEFSDNLKDRVEAITWYLAAARQNHVEAQFYLASAFFEGKGGLFNEEQSLEWMRKAADQGHAKAKLKLAQMYAKGIGEPRDVQDKPIALLGYAARLGVHEAADPIIHRHLTGFGTPTNILEATIMFTAAELHGSRGLQETARIFALRFNGTPKNPSPFKKLQPLYRKAANPKETNALIEIGEMFIEGRHVPKDPHRAWPWFHIAAERGSAAARHRCRQIEEKSSKAEMELAKKELVDLEADLKWVAQRL